MGVVIGETADHRRQLPPLPGRHPRRHQHPAREAPPTLDNNVVVGAGAKLIGASRSASTPASAPAPSSSRTCRPTRPSSACPATSSPTTTPATTPSLRLPDPEWDRIERARASASTSSRRSPPRGGARASTATPQPSATRHRLAQVPAIVRPSADRPGEREVTLRLYNTLTRPARRVRAARRRACAMYVCGITPYADEPPRPRDELHRLRRRCAATSSSAASRSSTSRTTPTSTTSSSPAPSAQGVADGRGRRALHRRVRARHRAS